MGKLTLFLISILFSVSALSNDYVSVDRYTSLKLGPIEEQIDPLKVTLQVKFPPTITTTRQAVIYILDDSGYELVDESLWSPAMQLMMGNKLSFVHRDMSQTPMSMRRLLTVLTGETFRLVHDPLRRKVSFVLVDKYKGLVKELGDE